MDKIEIRRLYISDDEWNRTSASWKELKPQRNFNELKADDETTEECFRRLNEAGYSIPLAVIEQWIYPHYYNQDTVKNYSWIDYRCVEFIEIILPVNELTKLYVIEDYRDYVKLRAKAKPFDDFMCIPKDLHHWKAHSTWRVPPLVIDVASFTSVPAHAEMRGALQLVEGHTRLGYLCALENAGLLQLREHKVFLLRLCH
jgi:hypothetical protein